MGWWGRSGLEVSWGGGTAWAVGVLGAGHSLNAACHCALSCEVEGLLQQSWGTFEDPGWPGGMQPTLDAAGGCGGLLGCPWPRQTGPVSLPGIWALSASHGGARACWQWSAAVESEEPFLSPVGGHRPGLCSAEFPD